MDTYFKRIAFFQDIIPKLCVSLTARNEDELWELAQSAEICSADVIEWRVDYFHDPTVLSSVWVKLRTMISKPIIVTLRSQEEGGVLAYEEALFMKYYEAIIAFEGLDYIDIEFHINETKRNELINKAHQKQIAVILSRHYFMLTPSKSEMKKQFIAMDHTNCDICKLAVMPNDETDVINLMTVTKEVKDLTNRPLIAMAMGELGQRTRIQGEAFGSCLTFGMLHEASAPGQIAIEQLKQLVMAFHHSLGK